MPQQQSHDATQLVYPTVIAWPEGCDRQQAADLIAGTGIIDHATARLIVARDAPQILGRFEPGPAALLVQSVQSAGGDAFAPTMSNLAALGSSLKIKDMRLSDGNLDVDIWRGMTTTIRREHVQFLVRGRIRADKQQQTAARTAERVRDNVNMMTNMAPQFGWAARAMAERHLEGLRAEAGEAGLPISEKLDIHTSNGTIFQVDGDKFAFRILGEMRGHTDAVNMNRLAEMISHISPNDIVDEYFPLFRPPSGYHHLMHVLPELRRNNEDPAFAFYSRWAALLYRYVMGL